MKSKMRKERDVLGEVEVPKKTRIGGYPLREQSSIFRLAARAVNLIDSIELLTNGINSFVKYCLNGLKANVDRINSQLEKNLMVVTNLVPLIGYDKASEIARKASRNRKTIKEIILEMGLKIEGNLDELLNPRRMA
jgi:fumarate hydratase class II